MHIQLSLKLQRNWLFLLLAFISEGLNLSAMAESGSAQTTMALIVPSNGNNIIAASAPKNEYSAYVADTNVSVIEQSGDQVIYQVWISL